MASELTRQELDIWRGFRFMVEETSLGVSRALSAATGMSGGQFGILTTLMATACQSMRQQELAHAMRWDRTRLSHQLTRMEGNGWIKREKGDKGVTLVLLAEAGRNAQQRTAPMLGEIVKERFFSRLTPAQLVALDEIRRALGTATSSSNPDAEITKAPSTSRAFRPARGTPRTAASRRIGSN